jgi:hypothetical protein
MSQNQTSQTIGERVEELRNRIKGIAGSLPGLRDRLARAVARGDERQRERLREQIGVVERDEAEIGAAVDYLVSEQQKQVEAEEAARQAERDRLLLDLIDRRHALALEFDHTMMLLAQQTSDLKNLTLEIRKAAGYPQAVPTGINRFAIRNALWHHAKEFCQLLQLPAPPLAKAFPPAKRQQDEVAA